MGQTHSTLTNSENHALTGVAAYATIAARDADSTFNTDSENINKLVRVEDADGSGNTGYFILISITPTWLEFGDVVAGDVFVTGTPVDNQVAVWTSSSNIEGTTGLTFDGTNLTATGSISAGTEFQQSSSTILVGNSTLFNLFAGFGAGAANTTGGSLTAVGQNALNANTTGEDNTAVGHGALNTNISGDENTAFGVSALFNNTGSFNDAFGVSALKANTTGSNNSAFGNFALENNTTGTDNMAIGIGALENNILGRRNTAVGTTTGLNIASATLTGENTMIGYRTGLGITTGVQNTIIGANVIGLSTTLSNNIILADGAGVIRLQFDSSGDGTIGGGLQVTGTFKDSSGDVGTSGQILSSTVTGTNWIDDPSAGNVTTSATLTDNFLVRGNGTEDIDIGSISMDSGGTRLRAGAGTELLPTYSFTSNTNRGMYDEGSSLRFADDGFDVLELIAPSLAANWLQINAAQDDDSAGSIKIIPAGADADIEMSISSKGSQTLNLNTGTGGGEVAIGKGDGLEVGSNGEVGIGLGASTPSGLDGLTLQIRASTIIFGNANTKTQIEILSPASNNQLLIGVNDTGSNNAEAFVLAPVSSELVLSTLKKVNVSGNYPYINFGYATVAAETSGLVVNYLPTSTTDTVSAGAFVAGIASTSNPTVATVGAATFSASDIIQITGTKQFENDSLFEVLTHAANVLTIRGIGTTSNIEDFTDNQFVANTSDSATITKVTVSVMRAGTDGIWETATGSTTGFSFVNLATTANANVTSSATLTNNFLVRGNGTSDIDIGSIFMDSTGNNLTIPGDLTVDTNTLFVDSTNDRVGVRTTSPQSALHVVGETTNAGGTIADFRNSANSERLAIIDENTTGSIPGGFKSVTGFGLGFFAAGGTKIIFYTGGVASSNEVMRVDGGNFGVGISSSISAKLHVLETTEQLRVGFDATNYTSFTVSSGGDLTIAPTGSDTTITGNLQVSAAFIDSLGSPGTSGQVLSSTVTGTDWIDETAGNVDASGTPVDNQIAVWTDSSTIEGTTGLTFDGTTFTTTGAGVFGGDLTISTDGSSTGTPRLLGFTDYSSGEAARFRFGDNANVVQNAFGNAMDVYSFHTLRLLGDRSTTTALAFSTESNIGVHVINTTVATPAFVISGASSQTADLFQVRNNSGTVLALFDDEGNLGLGTTTPDARLDVNGEDTDVGGTIATFRNSSDSMRLNILDETTTNSLPPMLESNTGFGLGLTASEAGGEIKFFTGGKTISDLGVLISSSGFLGIGELSPDNLLHITTSTTDSTALIKLENIGTNAGFTTTRVGSQDPDGNVTGAGGDIYVRDSAALSNLFFNKEATTGTDWEGISLIPSSTHQIFSATEYEDLGTTSIITTSSGTNALEFNTLVVSSTRHSVTARASELMLIDRTESNGIAYTGSSSFITSLVGGDVTMKDVTIVAGIPGTQLFEYVGDGTLNEVDVVSFHGTTALVGWDLGTISRVSTTELGPIVTFKDGSILLDSTASLILDSVSIFGLNSTFIDQSDQTGFAGPIISFKDSAYKGGRGTLFTLTGNLYASEKLVKIDAGLPNDYRVNVFNTNLVLNGSAVIFDVSGTTGTFTLVANNSIASTSITGVTDSSGVASFTHAGTSPLLNSLVTVSGFTTNTSYNTTGIVTARTATTFEIDYVAFGTSETGSYAVTGVTVTSTAHGLTIGTGVTLDTTLSTDYDGGFLIYNIQTNSFDVPATFTSTKAGGWSTLGLDQTDPRVLASNNPGTANSQVIAFGFTNANSTATSITNGTYAAVDASTFTESSVTQRMKLTDSTAAIFTLTALEDFNGFLTGSLTAVKTGSTADYRFAMSTNGAIPVFASANYVPMEVKTTKVNIALEFSVNLTKGDTIQIMVAGDGTSDGLTITDLVFGIK